MKNCWPILLCLVFSGCSDGGYEDLKVWMEESSRDLRGKVTPLPEVKAYEPVPYSVENLLDPFRGSKIDPNSQLKQGVGKGGMFQPDFEAREQRNSILEKYPLESLTMIGRLIVNRQPIAVVKYENSVRQVKVGDYIGLDFGMVTAIDEAEIKLRELIQDSTGEWGERQSSLYLQVTEGGGK